MKKFVALMLAMLMVLSLAACGQEAAPAADDVASAGVLVFGTSADYAPYEFMYPNESGEMVYGGIDVSVAQYIADYMGKELQTVNMDFGYLLTALNKGDFDMVLACIEPTEERIKAVDFSDAYIAELPEMILIRAEDADKYQDVATDFDGVNVAAQTGTTKIDKATENLTGCNVVSLSLVPDMVNELVNGKVDAVYLDGGVAMNYVETNPDLAIAAASDAFADQQNYLCVAVAKGDPKGLLSDINAAIAKLTEEGKIADFQALADSLSGVAQEVSADAPEGYTPDAG